MKFGRFINRWGKIRQFYVPTAIFQDESLALSADALAVLLVLLQIYKNKPVRDYDLIATVKVGQETLIKRSGYSKNSVTAAVKKLENGLFIEASQDRRKRGEFATNQYTFMHPLRPDQPLLINPGMRNAFIANRLPYFTFPRCVVMEHTKPWSLAQMAGSAVSVYACLLFLANAHRANEFESTKAALLNVSGLAPPTLKKALDFLEDRGLVWVTGLKDFRVHICDPYTGEPLHEQDGDDENDPANYHVTAEDGRSKRLNLNFGDPEQVEKIIRGSLLDDEVVIAQGNGDLMIRCPFHHPDNTPSCSVSPRKNGCFHCFGCDKNGSLTTLLMQLKDVTKGEAIKHVATAMGTDARYVQPDSAAIATYSYRNENGKLMKQVLRYPDKDGQKVFLQRQPAKGDWKWGVAGLPPMLFNMEWLKFAEVVCIVEGEKDACTVTDLHLNSTCGLLVGVTSGGANSWDRSLVKHLRNKKVAVMPDADEAGAQFAAEVKASLDAEGIEYRLVTFDDVGQKDVTDFLEAGHTVKELVRRIGADWFSIPQPLHQEHICSPAPEILPCNSNTEEITV